MLRHIPGILLSAAICVASAEGAVQLWHRYQFSSWYSPSAMAARYSQTVPAQYRQSTPTDAEFDTHVVHPYVGYVFNSSGDRAHAAETFGYVHNRHPLPLARTAEQVNILVTGGSVAAGLAGGGFLERAYYR